MILAQVCLRLATIKGHSKMCSFTVLGVRKPVTIWCDNHLPCPSNRVDQVVYGGLWNVGPILFNGCAKLLDIGRNWNTLSYMSIQSIPNMCNGKHAVFHLPSTVKTGIHPWREHLYKVPDAIECEYLITQVGYDDELQSGRDPDEDDKHAD